MKKHVLIISLLSFVMPFAQAEWTIVDSSTKSGEKHYFDAETVQKNETVRKVWMLSSYDQKQKGGYHAIKALYELDCAHHRARPVTVLLYPDQKAIGAVIGARHDASADWFDFPTDSVFQYVSTKVCTP